MSCFKRRVTLGLWPFILLYMGGVDNFVLQMTVVVALSIVNEGISLSFELHSWFVGFWGLTAL